MSYTGVNTSDDEGSESKDDMKRGGKTDHEVDGPNPGNGYKARTRHRTYNKKKNITQRLLDTSLLAANSAQLKVIYQSHINGDQPPFYVLVVTLLVSSLSLQVMVGFLSLVTLKYDIKAEDDKAADDEDGTSGKCSLAEKFDDISTAFVMVIVVINVLIASFTTAPGAYIHEDM